MSERGDWHAWRADGIGASDIGALLGLSRWESPWSLWARKVGLRPPSEETGPQRRGHDFEPVISTLFTRETGLYVVGEQTWCQHPDEPWMRCTVDGFVTESPSGGDALGGFEAKTDGRFGWPDGVPPAYEAQAKWSMAVTGHHRWWIAVLFAGFRFEVYEIALDATDEAFMIDRARTFWHDHVLPGVQPATDGTDATLDALAEVYPHHDDGKAVELDGAALSAHRCLLYEKENVKRHEGLANDARARLEAFLGDAEVGTIDGERVVSWRTQHRNAYTVTETDLRILRTHTPKEAPNGQ